LKFLAFRNGKVEAFQHPYRSPTHGRSEISQKTYKVPEIAKLLRPTPFDSGAQHRSVWR
jgi:hypothetical protein